MAVFSGNAHPQLAQSIARCLRLPLARAQVGRFSDGEFNIEILENIRGRETFIIQPTCPPASENLMELLVMVDAARRASAARITAVVPYFGFARQDRRPRSSRVPITAKLVAKMFAAAGVDRVLTVDLHADQIQGFFRYCGRQCLCLAAVARRRLEAQIRRHGRRVAGRWRRRSRPRARQAPWRCRSGHHRQDDATKRTNPR